MTASRARSGLWLVLRTGAMQHVPIVGPPAFLREYVRLRPIIFDYGFGLEITSLRVRLISDSIGVIVAVYLPSLVADSAGRLGSEVVAGYCAPVRIVRATASTWNSALCRYLAPLLGLRYVPANARADHLAHMGERAPISAVERRLAIPRRIANETDATLGAITVLDQLRGVVGALSRPMVHDGGLDPSGSLQDALDRVVPAFVCSRSSFCRGAATFTTSA